MWTPGISTGMLNVTVVFLSCSSAFALGANAAPKRAMQSTPGAALKNVISLFLYRSRFCAPLRCHAFQEGTRGAHPVVTANSVCWDEMPRARVTAPGHLTAERHSAQRQANCP